MIPIWHGRNGGKPFNIRQMCWNLCGVQGLGGWKYLRDHCTWDLKNNLDLCYPMTWGEVKSGDLDSIMIRSILTLTYAHIV